MMSMNITKNDRESKNQSVRWSYAHRHRHVLPIVLVGMTMAMTMTMTMTTAFSTIAMPTTIDNLERRPTMMWGLGRNGGHPCSMSTRGRYAGTLRAQSSENDPHTSSTTIDDDATYDVPTNVVLDGERTEDDDIDDVFFTDAEQQADPPIDLPKGKPDGFYVIERFPIPDDGFQEQIRTILDTETTDGVGVGTDEEDGTERYDGDGDSRGHTTISRGGITREDLVRLNIVNGNNVTLPIALMLLDPVNYPSFSKARKACRKGYILIHEGPLEDENVFDSEKCVRGRVRNRVLPKDVIAKQVRMGGGFYPGESYAKPPFNLPVVYEDDHFAIVNKPAGIVVYSHRKGGHGTMTIRHALPFVLQPPRRGTLSILRRPMACHRLDRPTTGLLLIAKTKPAMVDVTRQFVERNIKKTYTAIINGIPDEPEVTRLTTAEAAEMGVDVLDYMRGEEDDGFVSWQVIDHTLDEKSAVTVWRPLQYVKSLKANDGVLTLVELKPKTGRYHQLRRHMVNHSNPSLLFREV